MKINKLTAAIFLILVACIGGTNVAQPHATQNHRVMNDGNYRTIRVLDYDSTDGEEEPDDIQCPIPMEDRVRNHTGIQCVFSSIEMLGRWCGEPKLMNPPITSRRDCKRFSGPTDAGQKLDALNVKYEQSYGSREDGIKLLKKAMKEKRGALFDIPGHAMVIVHYSKEEDRVCYVDNSDRTLKVQTMTIAQFNRRWGTWILVVYPDDEGLLQTKLRLLMPWVQIPIIDGNNPLRLFPENYIPSP